MISMIRNIVHYSNIFGFLWTLCISMFHINMPRWVLFGGIYLFVATWLIEVFAEKRWRELRPCKEWIHYAALLVLFVLGFIYAPWDGNVYFHHHTEQRIPLLAFGVIGFLGINKRYSRALVINTMVVVCVASIIFLLFKTGWQELLFSPSRSELIAFQRIKYINSHMMYDFYLNSTLIGMWYLLFHADRKPALWQIIVYAFAAVMIFGMLLVSEGRSGFMIGLAIIGLMTVIEICRLNKRIGIGVSFCTLVLLFSLSALHPRISRQTIEHDLRYAYWKSAFELIGEKPVLGYGISHAQEAFDQVNMKYVTIEDERQYLLSSTRYNDCHNQYIQSLLEFGILGLLTVLVIYLSPLFICWGKREWWLAFFFTLISMGQSLFDMFLTGQFNILYGLLFLMAMKFKDDYLSPARSVT